MPPKATVQPELDIKDLLSGASLILKKLAKLEQQYNAAQEKSGLDKEAFHSYFMDQLYVKDKKVYTDVFTRGKNFRGTTIN